MAATDSARQKALSKAQRTASNRLKQAHTDEWNGYMADAAKEEGIEDWKPRASAEERAAVQFQALLEQYPHLAEQVNKPKAVKSA